MSIRGDFGPLNTGLRRSQGAFGRSLGEMESRSQRTFRRIGAFARIGAVAGIAGLGIAARKAFGEFEEAERATKQTEAVIKSMGGVANVSAKDVERLANAISLKAGVDDEAIQSSQNLLLTFGNIKKEVGEGNDIFSRASQAVVDLSARFDQDLKSSAVQVGKALQDPIRGVTALRRVGVQLTDQQEEQIKAFVESGDILSAQKIILGELSKQTAGAAEAQATASDKMRVAINNLLEVFGKAFGPALSSAFQGLANFITDMQAGEGAAGKFADVLKGVGDGLGLVFTGISSLAGDAVDAIDVLIGRFGDLRSEGKSVPASLGAVFAQAINSIDLSAIGDKIGGAIESGLDFGDKFAQATAEGIAIAVSEIDGAKLLGGLVEVIAEAINALFSPKFWIDHFGAILATVTIFIPVGKILKIPGFQTLFRFISVPFFRAFAAVGKGIVSLFGKAGAGALDAFVIEMARIAPRSVNALNALLNAVRRILSGLPGAVRGALGRFSGALASAFTSAGERAGRSLARALSAIVGPIARIARDIGGAIISPIVRQVGRFAGVFRPFEKALRTVRTVAEGSFAGIRSAIQFVIDKVRALIGLAKKIKFPDINPFAGGGVVREGLALVGEEGPELVKHSSKTALVGQAGPEIRSLPTGTRVFSHPETKRKLAPLAQKVIQRLVPASIPQPQPLTQRVVRETLGTDSGRQSLRAGHFRGLGWLSAARKLGIPGFARGGIVRPWEWEEEEEPRKPGTGGPFDSKLGLTADRQKRRRKKKRPEPRRIRPPVVKPPSFAGKLGLTADRQRERAERRRKRERQRQRREQRGPEVIHVPHRGPLTKAQRVELRRIKERQAEKRTGEAFGDVTLGQAVQLRRIRERMTEKLTGYVPGGKRKKQGLFDRFSWKGAQDIVRDIGGDIIHKRGVQVGPFRLFDKRSAEAKFFKKLERIPAFQTAMALGPSGAERDLRLLAQFRARGELPPAYLVSKERALKRRAKGAYFEEKHFARNVPKRVTWRRGESGKGVYDPIEGRVVAWPEEAGHHQKVLRERFPDDLRRQQFAEQHKFWIRPDGSVYGFKWSKGQRLDWIRKVLSEGFEYRPSSAGRSNEYELFDTLLSNKQFKLSEGGGIRARGTGGPEHFGKPVKASATFVPAVRYLISTMKEKFGLSVSSGVRPLDTGSFHSQGKAADFVGARMREAAQYVKDSGLYKTLLEGIHNPNLSADEGKLVPAAHWGSQTWKEHKDHIHLAASRIVEKVKEKVAGGPKAKRRRITGGKLSVGQMVTLAKRVGFPDPALAAAVGYAESRGQVGAVGDSGDSLGLWQINTPAHPKYDHDRLQHDAFYNARAALAISKRGKSFQPWTQYRSGAYKQFLGRKGMPLPRGTSKTAAGGGGLADFIAMKLIPDEDGLLPSDSLKYINRGLRYWRGVRRRNLRAGNSRRAGDAKNEINTLLTTRKTYKEQQKSPEADLGDIQPFDVIGTGPNAFRIGGLQRVIDDIQLRIAEASLTVPPDTDDTQAAIKASLEDDITAATQLRDIWQGIYTVTKGIRVGGKPLPGGVFTPTKEQSKALAKTKNQTERINLLNRFITEATQGQFIQGTIKQKIDAATNLAAAKSDLKSLTDEAGRKEEPGESAADKAAARTQDIQSFLAAIGELFKQKTNITKLPSFHEGGIVQGPKGREVQIKALGGEAYFNPDKSQFVIKLDPSQIKGGDGSREVVLNKYEGPVTVVQPKKEELFGYAHAAEVALRNTI